MAARRPENARENVMTKKAWILAAVLAMPLIGCQSQVRPSGTEPIRAAGGGPPDLDTAVPDCRKDEKECHITVKVGPRCDIKMSHDWYVVAPHPGGVEMVWTIRGDATFDKNKGIDFKTPDFAPMRKEYQRTKLSNPLSVFIPSKVKLASDKEFRKHNQSKRGHYYYTVNIIQDGKPCPEYDPGVADQ